MLASLPNWATDIAVNLTGLLPYPSLASLRAFAPSLLIPLRLTALQGWDWPTDIAVNLKPQLAPTAVGGYTNGSNSNHAQIAGFLEGFAAGGGLEFAIHILDVRTMVCGLRPKACAISL